MRENEILEANHQTIPDWSDPRGHWGTGCEPPVLPRTPTVVGLGTDVFYWPCKRVGMKENGAINDMTTPPVSPPNGNNVTNAELYKTLYQMDQRLAERDTALISMVGGLRTDFSNHAKDGHPWTQTSEVVQEELRLDAKKAGVVAAVLAFVTGVATTLAAVIDKWVI